MFVRIALIALVLVGLWGAGRLSYDQFQTGEACPILGDTVPACYICLLYTSPSPRDQRGSRMPSSA